jgi:hypothetical protein
MQINYAKIFKKIESPYILRIFVIFIFVSLTLGLIFGTFLSFRMNSFTAFKIGIIAAVIGTSLTLGIIILIDICEKIKCYVKYGIIDFRINQERRVLIDGDYTEVFNKLFNILVKSNKIHVTKKDLKDGISKADTSWSWRSFGERIEIKLFRADGRVRVILTSKPKIITAMIDHSKNFENLELIIRDLKGGEE